MPEGFTAVKTTREATQQTVPLRKVSQHVYRRRLWESQGTSGIDASCLRSMNSDQTEETMIEVISAPENVVAFRVAGTVTADDYDKVIPAIEEKLGGHQEIGVLTDLSDFEDMTGDALKRDLQYGLSKLGELYRFKRAAVISDKQWIKAVTDMAGTLFPQIEARVFPETEKSQAMNWVSNVQ